MSDQSVSDPISGSSGQLTEVRVPLEDAAIAFTKRDENGRLPIIVIPRRISRVEVALILYGGIVLVAGLLLGNPLNSPWLVPVAIAIAVVLVVLAVFRSFMVVVPEGVNGLLARGGRYLRTVGSGSRFMLPNIAVSHLVTRRTIPFGVPVPLALTRDNVRVGIDILLTFSIAEPHKFVFNISADDFDQVLQASCQEAIRTLIRGLTAEEVANLRRSDTKNLMDTIGQDVEPFGIAVRNIVVTSVQPPADFISSQEARQLAVVQQAAEEEQQRLALLRQKDAAELAREKVISDAATESLRLERLQEQIRKYPTASEYDLQRARIQVAQALASNTRAMLQVGRVDNFAEAQYLHEVLQEQGVPVTGNNSETTQTKQEAARKSTS